MTETISPKRRGRPRKPHVERNRDGSCSVRTTIDVDGRAVRKQFKTGTADRTVARVIGKAAAAGGDIEALTHKGQTFREHAERIVGESTIRTKGTRLQRLRDYAYPEMGHLSVETIKVAHVKACLDRAAERNGWTGKVRHLKNDISAVLGTLYEEQALPENVARRISFRRKDNSLGGKRIVRSTLPRIILRDEEFERLVAFLLEEGGGVLGELGMLCLCARMLGGMRTSDLHAWRWEHVDIAHWLEASVPRPKTMGQEVDGDDYRLEPYRLDVDGIRQLVPHLIAWWRKNGCRSEGPIFPVRRGARYGEHKLRGTSYARELREALWRAGVVRPEPGYALARTEEERRALCALQSGMKGKRSAVDFHSFRRAFVTATANSGISFAESQRLADHADPRTHDRYVDKGGVRVVPEKAVPRISAAAVAKSDLAHPELSNDSRRVRGDSNSRHTAPEANGDVPRSNSSDVFAGGADHNTRQQATHRQNPAPEINPIAAAAARAIEQGRFDLAEQLLSVASQPSAGPVSPPGRPRTPIN